MTISLFKTLTEQQTGKNTVEIYESTIGNSIKEVNLDK
jgi:hypothetical protein